MKKAKDIFKKANLDIVWVGDNFKEQFYEMSVEETTPALTLRQPKKWMTDQEIFDEYKPSICTLGDIVYALNHDLLSKNGYENRFYVKNKDGVAWAVDFYWFSGLVRGGWRCNAFPFGDCGLNEQGRFVSRDSSDSSASVTPCSCHLESFDSLTLRIEKLEEFQKKVEHMLILE